MTERKSSKKLCPNELIAHMEFFSPHLANAKSLMKAITIMNFGHDPRTDTCLQMFYSNNAAEYLCILPFVFAHIAVIITCITV